MATSNQTNIFTGGLDLDTDKRLVKNDRTTEANDVEYSAIEGNKKLSIEPFKSTKYGYTIPIAEKSFQIQRLEYFGPGTYSFTMYDLNGNLLVGGPIIIVATNFGSIGGIGFLFGLYGYTAIVSAQQGDFYTLTFYQTTGSTPIEYRIVYSFQSEIFPTFTVQDAVSEDTQLVPLYENNIQDVDVVFSCGNTASCDEIGMVRRVNGTYVYTRIIRTNRFGFSEDNVFRIKLENQANDFYGVYWTDREHKPKAFYFPRNYTQDCALKYTPANYNTASAGYYTLSSLDKITDLQLYNNIGRIEYSDQLQAGGTLPSGQYRYAVRFGFKGTPNVTPFSYLSQGIPVFKTSILAESAYIRIQGDKSGEATTKANVLQIDGCQAEVFNYAEVACVYNANGVDSAFIFGKYDITAETITIIHYGTETATQDIDVAVLIDVSEIILKSGDIEIKKNRLNLVNNTVAIDNPEFTTILDQWREDFNDSFLQLGKKEIQSVGKLNLPGLSSVVYARVQPGTSVPLFVNNTIIYPQEIVDTYSEYNNTTGVYTLNSVGVTNIIFGISFNLVFTGNINGFHSTCYKFDLTLSKNGTPLATVTKDNLNLGLNIAAPNVFSVFFDSQDLFGNSSWVCSFGDTFTLSCRLYGSNLTLGEIALGDLSAFTASYVDSNNITDFIDTRPGEYQLPENVAKYTGYMHRDRYPLYFRFHMDNEYITKPFFAGLFTAVESDSVFNLFTDDNNLNNIKVYSFHAVFNSVPITALKALGVKGISVWRGIVAPKVLGSGVYMTADQLAKGNFTCGYYAGIPVSNGEYNTIVPNDNVRRNIGMLLSPDIQANKTDYSAGNLVVLGVPSLEGFAQKTYFIPDASANQKIVYGSFAQYKGYRYFADSEAFSAINGQYCEFNTAYNTPFSTPAQYAPSTYYNNAEAGGLSTEVLALQTDDPVNAENADSIGSDNGLYLAQYELDSVIDTQNIKCVPTGCFIEITDSTPSVLSGVQVFGGDTYTQKSIRRLLYGTQLRTDTTAAYYSFITYYAQNRVNTQLFYTDKSQPVETYNLSAAGSILRYLFPPVLSNNNPEEQFNRDLSYTAQDKVSQISPYKPDKIVNSVFGSRIWYSEQKPTGSVYDFYRKILPLSFKDLDAKDGSIIALCDVNDSMIAIQPNAVSLLPYQSDVVLSSDNSSSAYIGSGGVYAQREEKKSIFGASIRTGIHLSKNENGNDTLCWYSDTYNKFMKFSPYDGIRCISEENNVRSWFINKTNLISVDFDIILGYNIQLGKYYITARAVNKTVEDWDVETPYETGDVINYQVEGSQQTFEYLPNLYRCVIGNTGQVPFGSELWEYIQPTDTDYYNYWTLVYSEKYRAFTTFTEILPRRYFEYMSMLLCPNPRSLYNVVYEMDSGDGYMEYFDQEGDFKQGQFRIAALVNERNPQRKKMKALAINVGEDHVNNPLVTITTETQNSTVLTNEMELRSSNLVMPIKNDGNDNPIISSWAEIKIVNTLFMRISNFITTIVFRERTPFK